MMKIFLHKTNKNDMAKQGFYGVINGRGGSKVYDLPWEEVRKQTDGFPGALARWFETEGEGLRWIEDGKLEKVEKPKIKQAPLF